MQGLMQPLEIEDESRWPAVLRRDRAEDGRFIFGVLTTGVFCKPSRPARRPNRENVRFFQTAADAVASGLRPCLRCRPAAADEDDGVSGRLIRVCRYIERNLDQPSTLAVLSRVAGLSPFHFQRSFKAFMGMSPREYAQACRLWALKRELRGGHSVTRALFDAGFSSSSRLYENVDAKLGMQPSTYRRGGAGATIRYAIAKTDLGPVLVAATERGVCSIQFGDSEQAVEDQLREEFPAAALERDAERLRAACEALERYISGHQQRTAALWRGR